MAGVRQPCATCGEPKLPGPGQKYCGQCRENARSLVLRDRAARAAETPRATRAHNLRMANAAEKGTFWCTRCQRYLPTRSRGKGGRCRPCHRVHLHAQRIRMVYGITAEQYDAMLAHQNDACAICFNHPKTVRLAVDHNHHTGEVRGLLCKRCNRDLLGKAGHDPAMLRRAADYLDSPPSRGVLPEGHVVPGTDA